MPPVNRSPVLCNICLGTKIAPTPHPHECGACLGTGRSTAPWDQPRRGCTVGLRHEDFQRVGVQERTTGYTEDEIRKALLARGSKDLQVDELQNLPDLEIHDSGRVTRDHNGRQKITGILISWKNPNFSNAKVASGA